MMHFNEPEGTDSSASTMLPPGFLLRRSDSESSCTSTTSSSSSYSSSSSSRMVTYLSSESCCSGEEPDSQFSVVSEETWAWEPFNIASSAPMSSSFSSSGCPYEGEPCPFAEMLSQQQAAQGSSGGGCVFGPSAPNHVLASALDQDPLSLGRSRRAASGVSLLASRFRMLPSAFPHALPNALRTGAPGWPAGPEGR
eukprot:TRINITY_DN2546_c0_g1_i1.p1 TRINITY_DN2546_c0_g1~~TRINITY_DN2546_c0_g1_i1.p1  ORF type:complete len:196 (-),score=23.59 TRINITY_DN2546_c0_g1_i1:71-658(-)